MNYHMQKINEKKSESSKKKTKKNRYTMGPIAFARKRHEMEQAEGKPPSPALMYMETRKRTPGKNYNTSEVNIDQIEFKDQELLGSCSKKVKGHSNSSVIIPDEFLHPYRDEIVKDTIVGVLKMFEHLPSDVLAPIASSFENRLGVPESATNVINGQSSREISYTELYR
ncbi:hypothetical protein PHJA_000505000 [Phtheirospermum japonicum]|uniref:Uncharacterized protein n=1 Tax=Phtheirospermum japonicum TaxID=374723 RepID=A0A830B9C8_9LAMI|nr:hypothetical protein PHJA_000505000 [Phtheirospermum japonicum]